MRMRVPVVLLVCAGLSGCAVIDRLKGREKAPDAPTQIVAPVQTAPLDAMGAGQSPQALDQTSAAEKAAALAAPAKGGERELGRAVVALGPPAEQGLWVQTGLVTAAAPGRVVAPNGQSLAVELRPGTGGALMSLAAYQALGIGLTDLPELVIYGP